MGKRIRHKFAVYNYTKIRPGGTMASDRIASFIASSIGCPLIDNGESANATCADTAFVVNGVPLFCGYREEMRQALSQSKAIVYISNDIAIKAPSFVTKTGTPISTLSAHESPGTEYMNWNALTFIPGLRLKEKRHIGLSYYGAYRKGRDSYFKKYLARFDGDVFISTSKSGTQKFLRIRKDARFFSMSSVITDFSSHSNTIYIEDEASHKTYCSPANRFYECLSAGVMMHFDRSCLGTFNKAGIDISRWIVDGPEGITANDEKALQEQRAALYDGKTYRDELHREFREYMRRKHGM